ncbi:MAG: ribosome biogenesis GTPase Der [Deltaproteobacteria bacterium]|nr:ribosome biogenesis GTPase Der [Deltaproteobacteria bacterium]MBW2111517.1 ribosome biogenesis GTPase Der [Deltaproteobacteria bacterium]
MIPVIVIVGRPNVGKSTLFNRLSRSRTALVDDRPGITRDRLYAKIAHDGITAGLVDTGGFEDLDQDPLLKEVREQVKKAVLESDRVIFMADGREGIMPGDEEMARILRKSRKEVFLAVNKIDGPEHDHLAHDFYKLGFEHPWPISAAHGYGVKAFMARVFAGLPGSEAEGDDPNQIRVAVLGRPNAGKSSLINRILKQDRLVVSELPGTTRDTVDTLFRHQGREYLLIDTAGLRRRGRVTEKIDKFSMIKAVQSLDRCHVALILLDAAEGISDQDARICGYAFDRGRGVVLVVNKWDLIKGDDRKRRLLDLAIERQLKFMAFSPRINVSALTGERVMKLFGKIDTVYDQFSKRIATGAINRWIQRVVERHPPPRVGRGRLKFFYATQTRTRPPTFVVFVNRPRMIHFSYERFLVNQLRQEFNLEHTPIRLRFRER